MSTNDVGYKVFKAAKKGSLPLLTEHLRANASISIYNDKEAQNALHWAVINDNPKACFELVSKIPALLEGARNLDDATPLVLAAKLSRWECLLSMLRAMSPLNTPSDIDPIYAGSALLLAVKRRQVSVTKALLEHKAPKEQRDVPAGRTPLLCAVKNRDAEMIHLLRAYQASDEATDLRGDTAMSYAVSLGYWDCVIALCENIRVDAEMKEEPEEHQELDEVGYSIADKALLQAVKDKQYAAAYALLKYAKANPKLVDDSCNTHHSLLHLAVINEQPEMVALLVAFGASFEGVHDCNGDTPLHLAVRRADMTMIEWCKQLGADPKKLRSKSGVEVVRFAADISSQLTNVQLSSQLTESVNSSTSKISPAVAAIAKGSLEGLQQELGGLDNLSEIVAPQGLSLLEYAVALQQTALIPALLEKSDDIEKDKAFQLACRNKSWKCAEAVDKVGGLVASLDDKYYHQLSWHRCDNQSIKQRFVCELNMKLSRVDNKSDYFEKAAQSKTARYRQFLIWKKEPTRTSEQLQGATIPSMSQ